MNELLRTTADRAGRYLAELPERRVAPDDSALRRLADFDEPFPDGPDDPADVIGLLDEARVPRDGRLGGAAVLRLRHRRFAPGRRGGELAGRAPGTRTPAPSCLPGGGHARGGRAALAPRCARPARRRPSRVSSPARRWPTSPPWRRLATRSCSEAGWDVEAQGLFGAPPITVVVGDEAHPSVLKALGVLGLGRQRVQRVPVDGAGTHAGRRAAADLGPDDRLHAGGQREHGRLRPVGEIVARAHAAGAWVHVDGAFGLWAAAARRARLPDGGIEEADSWATDAHKWLNVPYDSGLAFVRDPEALRAAMAVTADYLPDSMMREPAASTSRALAPRPGRRGLGGAELARPLRPRRPRRARLPARRALRRGAARRGFRDPERRRPEPGAGVVRRRRDDARVIAAVQADGTCWCGGTVWQGRTAMRISVSSWATTDDDVERSLAAMIRLAKEVRRT